MADNGKLEKMLIEQNEKNLILEAEIKRLSYRIDKLEADSNKSSDDLFDEGRMIRS
jgi:hypothetical protein